MSKIINKCFNVLQSVFGPNLPECFGVDPHNRIRPSIVGFKMSVQNSQLITAFIMRSPQGDVIHYPTSTKILIWNDTCKTMHLDAVPFATGYQEHIMKNVDDWNDEDSLYVYMALSNESWYGNYNLVARWLS